jgi:23S rRNA (pseudouridine1915-N3)-methyltransferase
MPEWVDLAWADYARRMPGGSRLELHAVDVARGASDPERARADEARRLRGVIPGRAAPIALDVRGRTLSTEDLAARAGEWNRTGAEVAFIAGGPEGLDPDLLADSEERWSLSALTLPHALVRVVLAEQLYRALSILHNHPYHR